MKNYLLRRQLHSQDAKKAQIHELVQFAQLLETRHDTPHLDPESKLSIARDIGFTPSKPHTKAFIWSAGSFAVFMAVIISAQFSHPGAALNSVKRGTDQIRTVLQPGFKEKQEAKKMEQSSGDLRDSSKSQRGDTHNDKDKSRGTSNNGLGDKDKRGSDSASGGSSDDARPSSGPSRDYDNRDGDSSGSDGSQRVNSDDR